VAVVRNINYVMGERKKLRPVFNQKDGRGKHVGVNRVEKYFNVQDGFVVLIIDF